MNSTYLSQIEFCKSRCLEGIWSARCSLVINTCERNGGEKQGWAEEVKLYKRIICLWVQAAESFLTWPFSRFDYFLFPILSSLDFENITVSWLFFSPYCILHLSLLCCLFLVSSNSKHWSAHGLSPILHYLLCSHLYADNFTFTIRLVYSSAYLTIWLNRYLIGISNLKHVQNQNFWTFCPKPDPLSVFIISVNSDSIF